MSQRTYTVAGMTCGHCVRSVGEEVGRIDGVTSVTVDLPTGVVTVDSAGDLDAAEVRAAIEDGRVRADGLTGNPSTP